MSAGDFWGIVTKIPKFKSKRLFSSQVSNAYQSRFFAIDLNFLPEKNAMKSHPWENRLLEAERPIGKLGGHLLLILIFYLIALMNEIFEFQRMPVLNIVLAFYISILLLITLLWNRRKLKRVRLSRDVRALIMNLFDGFTLFILSIHLLYISLQDFWNLNPRDENITYLLIGLYIVVFIVGLILSIKPPEYYMKIENNSRLAKIARALLLFLPLTGGLGIVISRVAATVAFKGDVLVNFGIFYSLGVLILAISAYGSMRVFRDFSDRPD